MVCYRQQSWNSAPVRRKVLEPHGGPWRGFTMASRIRQFGSAMLNLKVFLRLFCVAAVPLWSQSAPNSDNTLPSASAQTHPNPDTAATAPVHVSEKDMKHFVKTRVAPVYSPFMLQTRIAGTVQLRVLIDKTGVPIKVSPIFGHPVLIPAAIDAAKQWRYKPYLVNGTLVEIETENTFRINYPR